MPPQQPFMFFLSLKGVCLRWQGKGEIIRNGLKRECAMVGVGVAASSQVLRNECAVPENALTRR